MKVRLSEIERRVTDLELRLSLIEHEQDCKTKKEEEDDSCDDPNQLILNVGGQLFPTSRDDIARSHHGSLLHTNFCGRHDTSLKEVHTFFIDHSPVMFDHVLQFVRPRPHNHVIDAVPPLVNLLHLPHGRKWLSENERKVLLESAQFYGLPALTEAIHQLPSYRTLNVPSALYRTIQSAVDAIEQANDVIVLAAGTYNEKAYCYHSSWCAIHHRR